MGIDVLSEKVNNNDVLVYRDSNFKRLAGSVITLADTVSSNTRINGNVMSNARVLLFPFYPSFSYNPSSIQWVMNAGSYSINLGVYLYNSSLITGRPDGQIGRTTYQFHTGASTTVLTSLFYKDSVSSFPISSLKFEQGKRYWVAVHCSSISGTPSMSLVRSSGCRPLCALSTLPSVTTMASCLEYSSDIATLTTLDVFPAVLTKLSINLPAIYMVI